MMPLATPRLSGRPVAPEDLTVLRRLHADPRAAATLSETGTVAPERTQRLLDRARAHADEPGLGLWLLRDPADAFIGYCGLLPVRLPGRPPEIEILYAVVPEAWHQGFAREMAAAVLAQARAAGLREVVGFTLPDNIASRRVLEGRGFALVGEIVHAGLRHVLYRIALNDRSP